MTVHQHQCPLFICTSRPHADHTTSHRLSTPYLLHKADYDLQRWTGKTPLVLLNELCQKRKWLRPNVHVAQSGTGFTCKVILACKNDKETKPRTIFTWSVR